MKKTLVYTEATRNKFFRGKQTSNSNSAYPKTLIYEGPTNSDGIRAAFLFLEIFSIGQMYQNFNVDLTEYLAW